MDGIQMLPYIYLSFIVFFNSVYFAISHRNSSKDVLSAYEIHSLAEEEIFNDVSNIGTGAKVTVAAITTTVLCFIIFLMSLWICRRHKKLCWSSDCAGPLPESNSYSNTPYEPGVISERPVSSAPMLHVGGVPTALDKDLPPSYESLFPENQNSTTT